MKNISILAVTAHVDDTEFVIYPTLIKDDHELIMVDCAYPGSAPLLEAAMNQLGLSLNQLTKIIITHHDHDHMGALKEIKDRYPSIQILCSKQEAPYITGQLKSLRLQQAEAIQDSLPDSEKEGGIQFQNFIASIQKVDVEDVTIINSGDILPYCGGIEVIDTKGHMPGHISLYVKSDKTLIAGDALVVEEDKLCMAMPQFILNVQDAQNSVRKLFNYDIEAILCYHGGLYEGDINDSLESVIKSFA